MTDLRVHALQPVDRGAAAGLFCAAFPLRAKEVQTWREPPSPTMPRRWVARACRSEEVIAYSALWRFARDGCRMDLVVAPDRRRRGVGGALLADLEHAAVGDGMISMQARADDGWVESLVFLHSRGVRRDHADAPAGPLGGRGRPGSLALGRAAAGQGRDRRVHFGA